MQMCVKVCLQEALRLSAVNYCCPQKWLQFFLPVIEVPTAVNSTEHSMTISAVEAETLAGN